MGTLDAYENMMNDLQEKAQMLEWISRHNVMFGIKGDFHVVSIIGPYEIFDYSEATFLNSIRKAMIHHV